MREISRLELPDAYTSYVLLFRKNDLKAKDMTADTRKMFLSMASRKTRSGSGSHPLFLHERTDHYGTPALNNYFKDITFAVVGGLATRLYMPERATLDADVLVLPSKFLKAESAMSKAGGKRIGSLTVGGSTWRLPDGLSLDILALEDAWVEEALETVVTHTNGLPYITLPYLVLMKLASGRVQDLADITRMLGAANESDLKQTRDVIKKFSSQDADDLESMIQLGKLEYEDR